MDYDKFATVTESLSEFLADLADNMGELEGTIADARDAFFSESDASGAEQRRAARDVDDAQALVVDDLKTAITRLSALTDYLGGKK